MELMIIIVLGVLIVAVAIFNTAIRKKFIVERKLLDEEIDELAQSEASLTDKLLVCDNLHTKVMNKLIDAQMELEALLASETIRENYLKELNKTISKQAATIIQRQAAIVNLVTDNKEQEKVIELFQKNIKEYQRTQKNDKAKIVRDEKMYLIRQESSRVDGLARRASEDKLYSSEENVRDLKKQLKMLELRLSRKSNKKGNG